MAEWINIGANTGYYYYPLRLFSDWTTRRRNDENPVYHEYGDPAQLVKLLGKVVRGYDIKATQQIAPRNNVTLAAWPYLVTPQPQLTWTQQDWYDGVSPNRSATILDTGRPIGRFPDDPRGAQIGTEQWLGLYSADSVFNRADTSPPEYVPGAPPPDPLANRFHFTRYLFAPEPQRGAYVLVDDPPTWEVLAPPSVTREEIVPLKVRVFWPDQSPVPELSVTVRVGLFTSVRNGSAGGFSMTTATALTDADGIAHFELRGDHAGVEPLQIVLGPNDAWRTNFFDPPFDVTHNISVAGLPGDDPSTGCYDTPAIPGIPHVPGYIEYLPTFQWDAGANSFAVLDGDVRVAFTMQQVIGVVVGFTTAREDVADYARMSHAFSFTTSANGRPRAQVMEGGSTLGPLHEYTEETMFEIRRYRGSVTYLIDAEQVYVSRVPSSGALSVGTSLYASGDTAPSPESGPTPAPAPAPSEVDLLALPGWYEGTCTGAPVDVPIEYTYATYCTSNMSLRLTLDTLPALAGKTIVGVRADISVTSTTSLGATPRFAISFYEGGAPFQLDFEQHSPTDFFLSGEYSADYAVPSDSAGDAVLNVSWINTGSRPTTWIVNELVLLVE